ncbi:MAG: hypothetical protein ACLVJB_00015 [Christensenellales bacterium]
MKNTAAQQPNVRSTVNPYMPKESVAPTVPSAPKAPVAPTMPSAPKAPDAPTMPSEPKAPDAPTTAETPTASTVEAPRRRRRPPVDPNA